MVNLSSRPFSLTINGTNYTSHLLEAKLNDSPWDESGEIATMLEAQIWGALAEVDPLVNADLKHGAEVVLKIANDAGTIPVARDRTLYIVRLAFNEETHVCSFTACDKLTWNNWDEELDDQDIEDLLIAQNAFDDGIQHAELARLFLQEKGLSASVSTFPDYRINYMVSPDTWVSGAREIVASALGYIWVAPSGAIEIRPINTAASPAFHLSLSQCDSDRASQEVTPAEKVIAVCNQPITSRTDSGAGVGNTWSETGNTSSQKPDDPDPADVEIEVSAGSGAYVVFNRYTYQYNPPPGIVEGTPPVQYHQSTVLLGRGRSYKSLSLVYWGCMAGLNVSELLTSGLISDEFGTLDFSNNPGWYLYGANQFNGDDNDWTLLITWLGSLWIQDNITITLTKIAGCSVLDDMGRDTRISDNQPATTPVFWLEQSGYYNPVTFTVDFSYLLSGNPTPQTGSLEFTGHDVIVDLLGAFVPNGVIKMWSFSLGANAHVPYTFNISGTMTSFEITNVTTA